LNGFDGSLLTGTRGVAAGAEQIRLIRCIRMIRVPSATFDSEWV
jgi:hypothetical protein